MSTILQKAADTLTNPEAVLGDKRQKRLVDPITHTDQQLLKLAFFVSLLQIVDKCGDVGVSCVGLRIKSTIFIVLAT